jgi:hypothetical protein
MHRYRDTPCRYSYDGMWGLSAVVALRFVQWKRRKYYASAPPLWREHLNRARSRFAQDLKEWNESSCS